MQFNHPHTHILIPHIVCTRVRVVRASVRACVRVPREAPWRARAAYNLGEPPICAVQKEGGRERDYNLGCCEREQGRQRLQSGVLCEREGGRERLQPRGTQELEGANLLGSAVYDER